MVDVGELVLRIKADSTSLERELKKVASITKTQTGVMGAAFSSLTSQVKALAPALGVAALVAYGRHALVAADHINDLALRTGLMGSTISALEVPLKQSGSGLDDLSQAVIRLNNNLGEAVKSKEAAKNFTDIGLSVSDLLAMNPDQRLFAVARAINGISEESKQTNAQLAIMGRGGASLLPMFKELGSDLDSFVKTQKELGNAISELDLKKIDDFGDAMTANFHAAQLVAIRLLSTLQDIGGWFAQQALDSGVQQPSLAARIQGVSVSRVRPNVASDRDLAKGITDRLGIENVDDAQEMSRKKAEAERQIAAARRAALLEAQAKAAATARESLKDYNTELERQSQYAKMLPSEAAGAKVYYDTLDLAQKAGVKNAEELAEANAAVARSNYQMQEAMQESARFSAELKDQFAATAKSIVFESKSAGDALKRLAQALAEMIVQRSILGPLSDGLFGSPGGGGGMLGNLLPGIFGSPTQSAIASSISANSGFGGFFAEGGTLRPGQWGIAGEDGPEPIFAGSMPLTVTPNSQSGGGGITVIQHLSFNNSVSGAAKAEIMNALPHIVAVSKASVFEAIQRGGSESRIANKRN